MATKGQQQKLKVLVVDDAEPARLLIERSLASANCEIAFAADGLEAVEMHKTSGFDVVLLDIEMPVLDGYVAARCIRKHEMENSQSPALIVAVTSKSSDREREKAYISGCDMLLAKPFKRDVLIEILDTHREKLVKGPSQAKAPAAGSSRQTG